MSLRQTLIAGVIASAASLGCQPPDSCFVRGTRVRTKDGSRAIEDLRFGDIVLAFDHGARAIVERRVVDTHRALVREIRTLRITANDGTSRELTTTPAHPFWVESRNGYVAVRDLNDGDVLLLRRGDEVSPAVITSIHAEERPEPTIEVFNISVETPESNYFADDVLVHNKEPEVRMCADSEITIGQTSRIATKDGESTYEIKVSSATYDMYLRVEGYGREPGRNVANIPLSDLVVPEDASKEISVTFTVKDGLGVTLVLTGSVLDDPNDSCKFARTVDAVPTP